MKRSLRTALTHNRFTGHVLTGKILTGIICLGLTIVVAVTGYVLAGWSVLDAFYMSIITIFGVGYGEVRPVTSPPLRVFTILVIVAGYTSVAYIVGGFVQMITEGEIKRALGARRMTQEIGTLHQHVILCGFGRMGRILAQELEESNYPFVIIDSNPERVIAAAERGYLIVNGNAADDSILQSVGIDRAKALATVLPDDASNVFITLTARSLNPELMLLARGEYPSTEKKLRLAGADHVVSPAVMGGIRMAHLVTRPSVLDFLEQQVGSSAINDWLSQIDIQLDEMTVPATSPFCGKTIGDLEMRGKGTFIIVALRNAEGQIVTHPSQSTVLSADDVVIVMGHRGDIPQFAQQFMVKRQMRYRGAKV